MLHVFYRFFCDIWRHVCVLNYYYTPPYVLKQMNKVLFWKWVMGSLLTSRYLLINPAWLTFSLMFCCEICDYVLSVCSLFSGGNCNQNSQACQTNSPWNKKNLNCFALPNISMCKVWGSLFFASLYLNIDIPYRQRSQTLLSEIEKLLPTSEHLNPIFIRTSG